MMRGRQKHIHAFGDTLWVAVVDINTRARHTGKTKQNITEGPRQYRAVPKVSRKKLQGDQDGWG